MNSAAESNIPPLFAEPKLLTPPFFTDKSYYPPPPVTLQSTRPSEVTYLEQIAKEMGPMEFFAQRYAEYHTKSLVCSVGWNHVKFQHFY